MANKRISELNNVTLPLNGDEYLAIEQVGETKKVSLNADNIPNGTTHAITTILEVSQISSNLAEIEQNTDAINLLENNKADKNNVLELDNTDSYTPTLDYHPATKKYVDDNGGTDLIGYRETGTPEDEDLLVEIGDFDNVGSGFRAEVDVDNAWLKIRSESNISTHLKTNSLVFVDSSDEFELLKPSKTGIHTENIATEQFVDTSLANFFDSSIVALNRRVIDTGATLDRKLRFVQEDLDAEATTPTLMWVNSAHKDSDLYSVLPTDGSGDFNIATQSNKWVIGEDGLLTEVLAGQPAYSYENGKAQLLVEPERTNLCAYSGFNTWVNQQYLTYNVAISPNGTMDAVLFSHQGGASPQIYLYCNYIQGVQYTASIWVKSDGTPQIEHTLFSNGGATSSVNFTPTNEWQRIETTGISFDSNGAIAVAKNSSSATPASFYIWHAQLEIGGNKTSEIPTNGSEITRLADNISVTTPAGITEITETINGVDNVITTIPTTYTMPNGLIDKITMR